MADDEDDDAAVDLVVDAANAVGARPDGWWRDRAGAAARLLRQLDRLAAVRTVRGPGGAPLPVRTVHAVLEGAARAAADRAEVVARGAGQGVVVHLAPADGDTAVVALAGDLLALGRRVVVVTADRGLRGRLPEPVTCVGPGWLRELLDELQQREPGE